MSSNNDIFGIGTVYITNNEGNEIELGKTKFCDMDMNVSIDLGRYEDRTVHTLLNKCEGSFKIINSSGLTRMITKYSNRKKYLKRVKNRQKLYNKLKTKGRKL